MSAVLLGSDLGIETAADLKQQLAVHLAQPGLLLLDAGHVQRIHTASLQVLCTFFRDREKAGHATAFSASSTGFHDAARVLGLSVQLGLTPSDNNNSNLVENAA